MSDTPHPPAKKGGWLKAAVLGFLGLGGGAVATYTTAVVDKITKPSRPVANFATTADGQTLICSNHASGDTGWWDFGDGTPLEPFDPKQTEVRHSYAKTGTYTVKLTVRNFVSDENERTVQVEVAPPSKGSEASPQITGFTVQPISLVSVAPATYRVTAEVKDAEHAVWDFGDGRLEVADAGKIDRLVTFDKPGSFGVQLVAHNGKQATKQAAAVKVETPTAGTLMAALRVTDSGSRVERSTRAETLAVQAPREKAPLTFSKTTTVKPGYTLVEATCTNPKLVGVKDLKVQIAADRQSATISGEWLVDPKAAKGAGPDLLVPLKLVEERTTTISPVTTRVNGTFRGMSETAETTLPLPPVPFGLTGHKRELVLEIRQFAQTGPAKVLVSTPLGAPVSGKPLWSTVINFNGIGRGFQATQDGQAIKVSYGGSYFPQ